ncbi:MAG TPA: S9 family peptidase, partial [Thermoanaerobaculia bacterium]|nr:S9 family peptidase [Thermoanaerobaculia bacterium]
PRFSPDGRWIGFVTGQGKADWAADDDLAIVPARGGAAKIISPDYDRHVEQFTWAPDSRTIYWSGPWNLREQLFRVGIDGSGFTDLSRVAGVATDAHFLPSRDLVAYVGESLNEPPEVFVSPLSRFAPRRLTDLNARYRDLQRAERRVVRWKNPQDGLEIEGILTLPIGYRPGERVPLLTFVHGGPSSQFSEEFLGYLAHVYPTHIFAARGYAVLQPNPRGSGAYGESFRQANRADWGGGDFRDVMAGVDSLIEQGIADPERLGIMGWSYGGFLSAWAITQTDRFRAASIGAPVVDLLSMEGTSDIPGFITSFFGTVPWNAGDLIRAHNPLSHVGKVKTPALIQHGEDDPRVPFSQSQMLHQALVDLGVPVTMVAYPRTTHTAREPRLRMDVMKRNLWWFDKWIKGDQRPYEEWKREFEK